MRGGPLAAVEARPGAPRPGQPVTFVGRVTGEKRPPADETRFEIAGPGMTTARLPAVLEGGAYHAAFTFFESGRYEVTFVAPAALARSCAVRTVSSAGCEPTT